MCRRAPWCRAIPPSRAHPLRETVRILFLNQYFPPDPAPTGILLRELGDEMERRGATVQFLSAGEEYRGGQNRGGRMRRELRALGTILRAGLRAPRADVVVSATSPPCLLIVATLIALRHRARSFHWVMDLYPELATALGEIKAGWLPRLLAALMGWCYRRAAAVMVLDEDMAEKLRGYGAKPHTIRPWVFEPMLRQLAALRTAAEWSIPPAGPWRWIYSGNLGRAHEWETLLETQRLLESRHPEIRLVVQGGGPARPTAEARARALGLERCDWLPYAAEDSLAASLLACHACAVTQLPAARGLLWPSKLGLLGSLPRPIVFVGDPAGAIAQELATVPGAGVFAPGESERLATWLLALAAAPPGVVSRDDPARERADALEHWAQLLGPSH